MSYPIVRDLAADGIPVTVTCWVPKIARLPYYRWLANPVTAVELEEACRSNALFEADKHDLGFGYRYLLDEARDVDQVMAERTAWRIYSDNGWWSEFGKKRGKERQEARSTTPSARSQMGSAGSGTSSRPTRRTNCGSATSPNTGP